MDSVLSNIVRGTLIRPFITRIIGSHLGVFIKLYLQIITKQLKFCTKKCLFLYFKQIKIYAEIYNNFLRTELCQLIYEPARGSILLK